MVLLRSTYSYPLDLQWEERSKRYNFLEMELVTSEHLLWSRYLSKAKVTVEAEDRAFVRVPHGKDGYSASDRFGSGSDTFAIPF